MPNLRQNIITGEWVIIAPEREKRPEDFICSEKIVAKDLKECPFCPNGEAKKTEIFSTSNIYVIPNKFPSFVSEDAVLEQGGELYPSFKALGYHEVIILKDHNIDLKDLPKATIDELLYVFQERMKIHLKDPAIEYSMVIYNHGPDSGATIEHPHAQIFASSILPPYVEKELNGAKRYFNKNKKCVFCELEKSEKEKGERVIFENEKFLAFCFFAARFPFEIWIMPKNHENYFEKIDKSERIQLAEILSLVFKVLYKKLNDPAYNFFIHTAPPEVYGGEQFFHWHLEITPRLSKYGGYELGSGIMVDVVSPEKAAMFLREN